MLQIVFILERHLLKYSVYWCAVLPSIGWAALAFERGFPTIALDIHLEDCGVVHKPTDGRQRRGLVGDDLAPFAEGLVECNEQGSAFMAAGEQLEQNTGLNYDEATYSTAEASAFAVRDLYFDPSLTSLSQNDPLDTAFSNATIMTGDCSLSALSCLAFIRRLARQPRKSTKTKSIPRSALALKGRVGVDSLLSEMADQIQCRLNFPFAKLLYIDGGTFHHLKVAAQIYQVA